ncbi:DUF5999 family protein [Streptomyces sp. NPDC052042]|uniref:DUF5999 family protein n=1 Tax=Streptomyces sp. NPDC052042 TaxID=3365683 RepID=UPI0037D8CB6D
MSTTSASTTPDCPHSPPCPAACAPDSGAARSIRPCPEQGWSLLCNGLVHFADTGGVRPDGTVVEPIRRIHDHQTMGAAA